MHPFVGFPYHFIDEAFATLVAAKLWLRGVIRVLLVEGNGVFVKWPIKVGPDVGRMWWVRQMKDKFGDYEVMCCHVKEPVSTNINSNQRHRLKAYKHKYWGVGSRLSILMPVRCQFPVEGSMVQTARLLVA